MSKIYYLFQFIAFLLCSFFGVYNTLRCIFGDYNIAYIILFAGLTVVMGNLARLSLKELR